MSVSRAQFFEEYARHRAGEGRALRGEELRSLPYLRNGPLARQWAVRSRSFDVFMKRVVGPMAARAPLSILDLGAGNCWLCHRLVRAGHHAVALDIRDDELDGLGAAKDLLEDSTEPFQRVKATFEALPIADQIFDITVFNASLHYATDLAGVIADAARVTRRGGTIAILDSPFYARESDGRRMVAEKVTRGVAQFGARTEILLSQNFVEFLTRERLVASSVRLKWLRHRVLYPLWYEARPLRAWINGDRRPSRFDVWSARVS